MFGGRRITFTVCHGFLTRFDGKGGSTFVSQGRQAGDAACLKEHSATSLKIHVGLVARNLCFWVMCQKMRES